MGIVDKKNIQNIHFCQPASVLLYCACPVQCKVAERESEFESLEAEHRSLGHKFQATQDQLRRLEVGQSTGAWDRSSKLHRTS